MVVSCAAYNCNEKFVRGSKISFHSFPCDPELVRRWLINMKRKDFQPSKYSRLCSKHFEPSCFDKERFGNPFLLKGSIPTVFEFPEHFKRKSSHRKPPKLRNAPSTSSSVQVPRPYKCDVEGCSRAYANNTNLRRHKHISHNPRTSSDIVQKYKCMVENCAGEFCSVKNLQRHIGTVHMREHPYTCDTCSKGFKTIDQLKTHEFEHTSIFPFRCDLCDIGFLTAYLLRRHNRRHKKRICPECGQEFKDALLLRKHHGLHHRKSYNCSTCGKLFFNKAMLTQHEVVHLKPSQRMIFPCPFETCSRFYYAKRNVDYHIRVFHQGKKNKQKCHVCGKELYNKQKLKLHLELHVKMGVAVDVPSVEDENVIEQEVVTEMRNQPMVEEEASIEIKQESESDTEEILYESDMSRSLSGVKADVGVNDLGNGIINSNEESENLLDGSSIKSEPVFPKIKQENDSSGETKDIISSSNAPPPCSEDFIIPKIEINNDPIHFESVVTDITLIKTESCDSFQEDPLLCENNDRPSAISVQSSSNNCTESNIILKTETNNVLDTTVIKTE